MIEPRIKWSGAAAVIVRDNQILMVKEKETDGWSIPSGGIEEGETPQAACIREVWEETGYQVVITKTLHMKGVVIDQYDVNTHYFVCEIVDGEITYHDPDGLVTEIAWKSREELEQIIHAYPEDRELLLGFL